MDEANHERCFERSIKAHQRVVERWRENRCEELDKLEAITEMHTQDALYRPLVLTEDVEEEFYAAVDEEMDGVRWV